MWSCVNQEIKTVSALSVRWAVFEEEAGIKLSVAD